MKLPGYRHELMPSKMYPWSLESFSIQAAHTIAASTAQAHHVKAKSSPIAHEAHAIEEAVVIEHVIAKVLVAPHAAQAQPIAQSAQVPVAIRLQMSGPQRASHPAAMHLHLHAADTSVRRCAALLTRRAPLPKALKIIFMRLRTPSLCPQESLDDSTLEAPPLDTHYFIAYSAASNPD